MDNIYTSPYVRPVFIGFASSLVSFIVSRILTKNKEPSLDDWITFVSYFLSAVILQLLFRYTGVSKKMCDVK